MLRLMRPVLFACLLVTTSCTVVVHEYDENTVRNLTELAEVYEQDVDRALESLHDTEEYQQWKADMAEYSALPEGEDKDELIEAHLADLDKLIDQAIESPLTDIEREAARAQIKEAIEYEQAKRELEADQD